MLVACFLLNPSSLWLVGQNATAIGAVPLVRAHTGRRRKPD
jgi:hypothetical protein